MRNLRAETNQRLLGNGHCSRPTELGCRYETICETCSFFATTIAFRDTLQDQHDDATLVATNTNKASTPRFSTNSTTLPIDKDHPHKRVLFP
ncbi:MAG: hypothetical protein ACXVGQ_10750 [Mycobacteriaceae bacterium]